MSQSNNMGAAPEHVERRVGFFPLLTISLLWTHVAIAEVTSNFVMPLTIKRFTTDPLMISLILSLNPLFGFIAQPWAGYFSDRIWTRLGRRRPMILGSGSLLVLSCLIIAFVPNIWALVLVVLVYQFTVDADSIVQRSLVADVAARDQRGRAYAMAEFFSRCANFLVLLVAGGIMAKAGAWEWFVSKFSEGSVIRKGVEAGEWGWYWTAAILIVIVVTPVMFTITEPKVPAKKVKFSPVRYYRELSGVPHFMLLCCVIGSFFVSYNLITNYYTLFATDNLGMEKAKVLSAFKLAPLAALIFALPVGWLCDRIPKKAIIIFGCVLIGISGFVGAFGTTGEDNAIMNALVPVYRGFFAPIMAGISNALSALLPSFIETPLTNWGVLPLGEGLSTLEPIMAAIYTMALFQGLGALCAEIGMNSFLVSFMPESKIGEFSGFANIFRGGPRFLMFPLFGLIIRELGSNYRYAFGGAIFLAILAIVLFVFVPGKMEARDFADTALNDEGGGAAGD